MKLNKKTVKTLCFIVFGAILFHFLLSNVEVIGALAGTVWSLVFPFLLGLIFAFLLNIPMRAIEKRLPGKMNHRPRRLLSFVITLLLVLLVLTFVSTMVIPQLVSTISVLAQKMPGYLQRIQQNLEPYIARIPELQELLQGLDLDWKSIGSDLFAALGSGAGNLFSSTLQVATSIISGATSFFIGIIFACYVLFDKEHLLAQFTGLLQAYLSPKAYLKVLSVGRLANRTFSKFVSGQCAEAVVICLMFLVVLWVGGFDYALLISVLIGFTSLIPIFGAFIGCIVGAFLILVSQGLLRCVAFVIVFLVVQQFDGNVTYPRIVGSSVGLPPIWVLVAVTVGGGLMGIFGMLFFIPLTSVLYQLLRTDALAQLDKKGITPPVDPTYKEKKPPDKKGTKKKFLFFGKPTDKDDTEEQAQPRPQAQTPDPELPDSPGDNPPANPAEAEDTRKPTTEE